MMCLSVSCGLQAKAVGYRLQATVGFALHALRAEHALHALRAEHALHRVTVI